MTPPRNDASQKLGIYFSIALFLTLAALFAAYTWRQNANAFFESQFVHQEFLQNLVNRRFTLRGFFTTYGEHLFPGYNLILAVNYLLFGIWGGFDSVVGAIFIISIAALVARQIAKAPTLSIHSRYTAVCAASLLLLSPTNNLQWGMALAATGGVLLIVVAAILLEDALVRGGRLNPWFFVVLPVALVLFLGGYAIGAVCAFFAMVGAHWMQSRRLGRPGIVAALTVVASLAAYAILVLNFGALGANKPESLDVSVASMARFAVLMTGASVLGKAGFEQSHNLVPYYALGAGLIALVGCACVSFVRRPVRGRLFMLGLAVYSATNIIAVSVFRYRNGIEGALGQWYMAHTHFIPVAAIYFLCELFMARTLGLRLTAIAGGILIVGGAITGYASDWQKAPYVAGYRQKFAEQAMAVLAFPETIKDKSDSTQTMLWDFPSVKKTIDMMHAHRLWIFKSTAPVVSGVTADDWLLSDTPVTVLCPSGSAAVRFSFWRPDPGSEVAFVALAGGDRRSVATRGGEIRLALVNGAPAVMIDASDTKASRPLTGTRDQRSLVGKVHAFECER